jgi:hypothetical protein
VLFLVVGIVVLVLLSSGEAFAEQHSDTSAADDFFAKMVESYNFEDGSSDPLQTVAEQGVVEGSGQLPFEEYNSPPDISGGQQVEQNKKQISHPICPGAVGNLILDLRYRQAEIRITNNFHHVECNYAESRYIAGPYRTYKLASFGLAWAEDNKVSEGIKKQLCSPDYIGWGGWSDNGKAASVTGVYLHDDLIGLKDEFKSKIKVGLGNAEARALTCPGRTPVVKPQEEVPKKYPELGVPKKYPEYNSTKHYCGPQSWEDKWGLHGTSTTLSGADFNYACYEHDKCYSECENSQAHCDQVFRDTMDASCNQAYDTTKRKTWGARKWWNPFRYTRAVGAWVLKNSCHARAMDYYYRVRTFGGSSYPC